MSSDLLNPLIPAGPIWFGGFLGGALGYMYVVPLLGYSSQAAEVIALAPSIAAGAIVGIYYNVTQNKFLSTSKTLETDLLMSAAGEVLGQYVLTQLFPTGRLPIVDGGKLPADLFQSLLVAGFLQYWVYKYLVSLV